MISIYETTYRKLRFGVYGGMVKPLISKVFNEYFVY